LDDGEGLEDEIEAVVELKLTRGMILGFVVD
jgi:hypothetical protein